MGASLLLLRHILPIHTYESNITVGASMHNHTDIKIKSTQIQSEYTHIVNSLRVPLESI